MNKDIVNAYPAMNAATQPTTEPAITDMSTLTQCVASGSRFANNTVTKLPTIGINKIGRLPLLKTYKKLVTFMFHSCFIEYAFTSKSLNTTYKFRYSPQA